MRDTLQGLVLQKRVLDRVEKGKLGNFWKMFFFGRDKISSNLFFIPIFCLMDFFC